VENRVGGDEPPVSGDEALNSTAEAAFRAWYTKDG
jgi:hypothetical protein